MIRLRIGVSQGLFQSKFNVKFNVYAVSMLTCHDEEPGHSCGVMHWWAQGLLYPLVGIGLAEPYNPYKVAA